MKIEVEIYIPLLREVEIETERDEGAISLCSFFDCDQSIDCSTCIYYKPFNHERFKEFIENK
jgi:hypothetical protein